SAPPAIASASTLSLHDALPLLGEYRERQKAYAAERATLAQLKDTPAITLDGIRISLQANIEWPEEAATALAVGAEGIGLFRSEVDRKSTRLNSSHVKISYAVFC